MNDKELYRQQKLAQIDEYEAKLEKLREDALASSTDVRTKLYKRIKTVELKLKEGKAKLEAIDKARQEDLESHKKAIDDVFIAINTHLAMS